MFYLRDESVDDLQKLLTDSEVQYDTEPPKGQIDAETAKEIEALQGQMNGELLEAEILDNFILTTDL